MPGDADNPLLQSHSGITGLPEAGSQNQHRPDVSFAAALHDGRHLGSGDSHDCQVDGVRQLGRRRQARHAENGFVVRVDGVDGAGEPPARMLRST